MHVYLCTEVWLIGLTLCPMGEADLLTNRIMKSECQHIPGFLSA